MVHSFLIEPDTYTAFADEAELMDKCKEWGLLSDRASKVKTFYYKGHGLNEACSIIGYVDHITAVIQLDNHQKHCIHPSYLKEMQAANYGVRAGDPAEAADGKANEPAADKPAGNEAAAAAKPAPEQKAVQKQTDEAAVTASAPAEEAPKPGAKRTKKAKLELPEGKVKMVAVVKDFTTIPNHFSDNDDEVVIYENAAVTEPELEIGDAWSSHSVTMKKVELEIGDTITFEAKIVAKKLTKHPVKYKLNNIAKIEKQES